MNYKAKTDKVILSLAILEFFNSAHEEEPMLKAKNQALLTSATGFSFTPAPPSSENHVGLHYEKISRLSNQYWKYKEFYKFPMFEGKVPNSCVEIYSANIILD